MNIKKAVSIVLVAFMLFAIIPFNVYAAEKYSDISNHWAKDYINKWSDYGILLGYPEGNFLPDNNITRAEMAVIINRVVEYANRSPASTYSDVAVSDWFYDAILKLHAADVMIATSGTVNPGEKITRQEAITMIAKAFDIYDENTRSNFTDESSVSSWALPYVRGMKANKYINGYEDGSLKPNDVLTRAEVVTILDNMIKEFMNNSTTYGTSSRKTTVNGNIVISSQDVSLINLDVTGDVYIMPGVGRGDVTITSTSISGTLYVWGGGSNTINLKNSSASILQLNNSGTRVYSSGSTLTNVYVIDGIFDADDSTKTTNINMTSGTTNLLNRSTANNITTKSGTLNIDSNSTVDTVTATSTAINVKSTATVTNVKINSGSGSSLTVNGTVKNLNSDVTLTVSGNGTVETSNLNNPNAIKLNSVTADGSSSVLTTKLTLTFDKDIANLAATDITIANSTSTNIGATRGTLTKVPNSTGTYELTINGIIASGKIDVTVTRSGVTITDNKKTVDVYYVATTNVIVSSGSITIDGGTSGNTTYRSSKITVKFDQDISNLYYTDFKLDGGSTGATILSMYKVPGTVGIYELNLSNITQSGYVKLSFSKPGYTFSSSSTATKYATYETTSNQLYAVYSATALTPLSYSITQDGSSTTRTTKLTFTFNYDVPSLTTGNFTISPISGATATATRTSIDPISNYQYDLYITPSSTASSAGYYIVVNVSIPGYSTSTQTIMIYNPSTTSVTFSSATQDGNTSKTTTTLTLNFSQDLGSTTSSLNALSNAITIAPNSTGATKGTLTKTSGTTGQYQLTLTGITKSGTIRVSIGALSGYSISPTYRDVAIHYNDITDVTLLSMVASDTNQDGTSDLITVTFDKDIDGFISSNITFSNNVTKTGNIRRDGTGVYLIDVSVESSTSKSRTTTITIPPITGYSITYNTRTTTVYYASPTGGGSTTQTVSYTVESDGIAGTESKEGKDTTYINVIFNSNLPSDFSISNIKFSDTHGNANIAYYDRIGSTYKFAVSNVTKQTPVTVTVSNITGYNFTSTSSSTTIYDGEKITPTLVSIISLEKIESNTTGYVTGFKLIVNNPITGLNGTHFSTRINDWIISDGLELTVTSVAQGSKNGDEYTYICMFANEVKVAGDYNFHITLSEYSFTYSNVDHQKFPITVPIEVSYEIEPHYDSENKTEKLIVTFDSSITDLPNIEFKVTNGTGTATIKGTPTRKGNVYDIPITVTKNGTIKLSIKSTSTTDPKFIFDGKIEPIVDVAVTINKP